MSSRALHIFGTGTVRPDPAWAMAAHSHPFHEIIAVQQGRLLLNSGRERVMAKVGDILFYRAGFVHEERSDLRRPAGTLFLSFETGDLLPWMPLLTHDVGGRVRQLIAWIIADERARRPLAMQGLFLQLLLEEMRQLCHSPTNPWIESLTHFMRENLEHPLTLDDLARQGNMSKFAFVRKFKRLSGRTPMEELRLIRLDRARTLFLTTDLPSKAIAPAVGIGDEFQLSKLFRAHFRLSPRKLRTRAPH